MVAMRECEPQGEDYLSSFPLSVPVWIIGNTIARPADYLRGQPASHWSNNRLPDDMLRGHPSSTAARSSPLCNCKALGLGQLRTTPAR